MSGIGGFMVRQRGRGGFFKPRGRRSLSTTTSKETTEGSKTDQMTSEAASDATAVVSSAQTNVESQGIIVQCLHFLVELPLILS